MIPHARPTVADGVRLAVTLLPERLRWAPHNLLAHPLSEVLFQVGFEDAGNWLHDATLPFHEEGTGRG